MKETPVLNTGWGEDTVPSSPGEAVAYAKWFICMVTVRLVTNNVFPAVISLRK